MPRLPWGIYFQPDGTIVFYGRRRSGKDIPGTRWMAVTAPGQRDLLDVEELEDLRVAAGGAVRRRTQAAIAARESTELVVADDRHFDNERELAVLALILDEINILRTAAGLAPRTVAQARAAYRGKLGR